MGSPWVFVLEKGDFMQNPPEFAGLIESHPSIEVIYELTIIIFFVKCFWCGFQRNPLIAL
jgi:hypothetical protein